MSQPRLVLEKMIDLTRLGNVGKVRNKRIIITPAGLIETPDLVMKLYQLVEEGREKEGWLADSRYALENVIKRLQMLNDLPSYSGLGFAIQAKSTLNLARWGTDKCPDVAYLPHNDVLEMTKSREIKKLGKMEGGAYCAFEAAVLNFERDPWFTYLRSRQTNFDKRIYLETVMPETRMEL